MKKIRSKGKHLAKPVSLYPLSFDEALAGLLQTKPPPKKSKRQTKIEKTAESKGE